MRHAIHAPSFIILALAAAIAGLTALLPAMTTAQTPAYITQWGGFGSNIGQFAGIAGIAVDGSGNVYVPEFANSRIQKFTSSGTYLGQLGSYGTGDGQFTYPFGIAVDAGDNVYVGDRDSYRIQKFSNTGAYLAQWGTYGSGDGQFIYPMGIAVDGGDNVYVTDWTNNRIQKFTSAGIYLTQWGTFGSGNGQFSGPYGVAVDANGYVYVMDAYNTRVQKFTSNGSYVTQWGSSGSGNGQFGLTSDCPGGLAVDASGKVYVADADNDRIQVFTGSGTYLTQWGREGIGDERLYRTYHLAIANSGTVFVGDYGNNRVAVFGALPPLTDVPGAANTQVRLYANHPNPFNPRTTIRFDLPAAGPVRLAVYDLAGRLVRVLVEGEIPAGSHEAVWDGRDASGRSAPSGSYLARLVAGGKVEGVRLSLVR